MSAPIEEREHQDGALASSSAGRGAFLVAAGILASRLMGLVRERVFAHYLGNSVAAAAFKAALRIPNFLQNLFGEGVLSASFIPVYASLLGRNERDEARRVASAVFGLLSLAVAVLVAAGVLTTPILIDLIVPGFEGEARELSIRLVRILFPGLGLLVLSAWCLGVLNSHRRFLLSYAAPVIWNAAIITTLLLHGRGEDANRVVEYVAYGAVIGSTLQFLIQLPPAWRLVGKLRPTLSMRSDAVRRVFRGFGPMVLSRGVVQVSAWIDTSYASLLAPRALSALTYAQTLYLLPVSLFGMAVSAAALPEMSRAKGSDEEIALDLARQISSGLRRISFFVIPSSVALFVLGDAVGGMLFETGRFRAHDTRFLWYILMGAAFGLVATTAGRLYGSAFFALQDTRTPLRIAVVRVVVSAGLGYVACLVLPSKLGVPLDLGAAGITVASSAGAWVELFLLRRLLTRRIGRTGIPRGLGVRLLAAALIAGALGILSKVLLVAQFGTEDLAVSEWGGSFLAPPRLSPVLGGLAIVVPFGVAYISLAAALGVEEAVRLPRLVLRKLALR